jgi:hypothetical protein
MFVANRERYAAEVSADAQFIADFAPRPAISRRR